MDNTILIIILALVVIGFIYKIYNIKINNLQQKLKDYEDIELENEELKKEKNNLSQEKATLIEKISFLEEIKEKYDNLLQENQVDKSLIKELQTKLDEEQKNFNNLKENFENLKKEFENLTNEKNSLLSENSALNEKLSFLEEIKEKYDNLLQENQKDKSLIKELQTTLNKERSSFEEKLNIIKKSEKELKESFENVANKILEEHTKKLSNEGIKNFENILNPLNTNLKDFKEKVDKLYESEIKNISSLSNELKNIKELNQQLSNDANNLTKALKGDVKKIGNWGEVILEKILEMSGLREGIEFKREVVYKEDNKIYRPDVIVYLPNDRIVVIDSKVSLNAYDEYMSGKEEALKNHLISIKRHIDTLANKQYESLNQNSLDFVLMFVPIEGALMLALENDPNLFEYAFKKRIILTSPTTLLVSLRSIEVSWRYERQAKNITEVVKMAERLYDKIRGFIDDFEKIGDNLQKAQKSFEGAKNKLITGKGNVISQISKLKDKSGIQPKKELPKDIVEIANIEE
jgi:DNA recombination protein RmuC